MNNELTEKLNNDYPEIFGRDVHKNHPGMFLNDRKYSMGFECDDGWYNHINALCATIMLYCKDHNKAPPVATQVKEKYGGLRFYIAYASIEIFDIIERFETESQYVCEICGEKATTRSRGGWYKTVCDRHYANWIERSE